MGYRFERDETLSTGVRRIAHELVDEATALLEDVAPDAVEASVHQARKNCKMLRGLVRLVRPGMRKAYRPANATARDAARELSSIRDAHALLETFDDLVIAHASGVARRGVAPVRAQLVARADAATSAVAEHDPRIARAVELLTLLNESIDAWPLRDDADVLAAGAAKTYKRGRNRWRDCLTDPTDANLHQWRKRVKYTWYHVRLLRDAAPGVLKPMIGQYHDLSDALGDDHDLAVLTAQLTAEADAFGGDEVVAHTLDLVGTTRADLQRRAASLGSRLYVESPKAFGRRLARYWTVWQEHGDELPTGEIADLASPDDDLDERSVRELYTIAQQLDVTGRSSMDRDGLIATIRATGPARS